MNEFDEIKTTMINRNEKYWENYAKRNPNNKKALLKCVSHNGLLLGYASDELRNDKELVLVATTNNFNAFFYASFDLKKDIDVVRAAYHSTDFEDAKFFLRVHPYKDFTVEFLRYFAKQNPANGVDFLHACDPTVRCELDVINCVPEKMRGPAFRRCFKYSREERALLKYLDGKITADEVDEEFWQDELFCMAFRYTAIEKLKTGKIKSDKLVAYDEFIQKLDDCVQQKHEVAMKNCDKKEESSFAML